MDTVRYEDIVAITKGEIKRFNENKLFNLYNKLKVDYEDIESYLVIGEYKMEKQSYENAREYVTEVINDISTEPTKYYKIELDKIRTYNEVFQLILEKGKKIVQHNEEHMRYEREILAKLHNIDRDFEIKEALQNRFLKIDISFFVNYTQKDLDNVMKPFIDTLFKYGNVSDNKMKAIKEGGIFKNTRGNTEFVILRITPLRVKDAEESEMLKAYELQERAIIQ